MKDLLQHQFVCVPRGEVEIKGVGDTECWFIEGRLPSRLS